MTWHKNAFLAVYLGVQIALPLRGFVYEPYDDRAQFSWNMYSRRYSCEVAYAGVRPEGGLFRIHHKELFNKPFFASRVYTRSQLPGFHAWLCDEADRRYELTGIIASGTCRWNYNDWVELIRPNVNICSDPDHAVTPQGRP